MRSLFLFDFDSKGSIELLVSCAFRDQGIPHGFTSRQNNFGARNNGPSDRVTLSRELGIDACVTMRQVHGSSVVAVKHTQWTPECDGVMTERTGLGLVVSSADCVPIFLVEPQARVVGVLHAGWRGVAAGILEQGLAVMFREFGIRERQLHIHFGPAICGNCYEVGPEVHEALRLTVPSHPGRLDLRAVLADRGSALGVDLDKMSRSTHCTICTQSGLFSHRGGDRSRQVAFMGIRG